MVKKQKTKKKTLKKKKLSERENWLCHRNTIIQTVCPGKLRPNREGRQVWFYVMPVLSKLLSSLRFLNSVRLNSLNNCSPVSYLRAIKPRARAWNCTMMSVSLRSLSSSKWASTPARKKILDWPIRYRLLSSSRLAICTRNNHQWIHKHTPWTG